MFAALAIGVAAALASPAAAAPRAEASGRDVEALLARADAAYARRAAPAELEAVGKALEEAERLAPGDYEVLWRLARLQFWLADDPSLRDEEKSRIGKRALGVRRAGDHARTPSASRAGTTRRQGWACTRSGSGS